MKIRQTSLEAFEIIQTDGTAETQRDVIKDTLQKFPDGLTREELHGVAGIMYSSTCARARELIKQGIVFEDGIKKNNSGKNAKILKTYREAK